MNHTIHMFMIVYVKWRQQHARIGGDIMSETRMSLTDLRQHLASAINRAAYAGERIVLISHGQPKAIIVGIDEWRKLEQRAGAQHESAESFTYVLAAADQLRAHVAAWQTTHQVTAESAEDTLQSLREGRDDDLDRVR